MRTILLLASAVLVVSSTEPVAWAVPGDEPSVRQPDRLESLSGPAVDPLPPGSPRADRGELLERGGDRETRAVGLGRLRISSPQGLSGAVGAMVAKQPADFDCTTVCRFDGLLVQLEPGMRGGRLGLGYAQVVGEKGDNDFFLSRVYLGFGVNAAILRTWGNASLNPADQTFLGAEGAVTLTRVNFSLGLFRHLSGGSPGERWLVSGGIGWGF